MVSLTKNLLEKHLLASPEEGDDFPDVSSYQKHIHKLVEDRSARGRERDDLPIRVDTVNISLMTSKDIKAAQKVGRAAESLAESAADSSIEFSYLPGPEVSRV